MKAEDLMIGDWVLCSKSGKSNPTPGKITAIEYNSWDGEDYFCDWVYVEGWDEVSPLDIFPIPLTPEILMKNHWIGHRGSWLHRHCDFLICQYEDRTYDLYFDGDKDSGYITIRFVHELQHALKLCGIDIKIVI